MIRGLSPIPRGGGRPEVSAPRSVLSSLTLSSGTSRGTPTGRRGSVLPRSGHFACSRRSARRGRRQYLHIGKPPPSKARERTRRKSHMRNNRAVTKKAARRKTGARLRTRDFRGDLHGGGAGNSLHIGKPPPRKACERIRPQPAPGAPPRRPKEKERPSAPLPSLKQSVDP